MDTAKEALPPAKGSPGSPCVSQSSREASPSLVTLSCLTEYYPSRMGSPDHNRERTEGWLAALPAHTPCRGGAEGKVGLGGAQQVGWEPFMGARLCLPCGFLAKARRPVFPPCRIRREPLEGCRGLLCTAFPLQRRSIPSEYSEYSFLVQSCASLPQRGYWSWSYWSCWMSALQGTSTSKRLNWCRKNSSLNSGGLLAAVFCFLI